MAHTTKKKKKKDYYFNRTSLTNLLPARTKLSLWGDLSVAICWFPSLFLILLLGTREEYVSFSSCIGQFCDLLWPMRRDWKWHMTSRWKSLGAGAWFAVSLSCLATWGSRWWKLHHAGLLSEGDEKHSSMGHLKGRERSAKCWWQKPRPLPAPHNTYTTYWNKNIIKEI